MTRRSPPRRALVLFAALAGSGLARCTRPRPAFLATAGARPHDAPYLIQAGDELEIRFFHTPGHDAVIPVRPDGFISLPLAYELKAAGRTPEEVRLDLLERYSVELASPELAVIVRTFARWDVHVGGEVREPGVVQLAGGRNVLDAVVAAGGFLPSADPAAVLVVRRGDPAGYALLPADLEALLAGRDGGGNLALAPFDVVYVPSSPIAEVNVWVDQYLRKNIPLTFSYRLDDNR